MKNFKNREFPVNFAIKMNVEFKFKFLDVIVQ